MSLSIWVPLTVPSVTHNSAPLAASSATKITDELLITAKAFAFAIVGAEYVLQMLPKGTHDYQKFIKPSEIGILGSITVDEKYVRDNESPNPCLSSSSLKTRAYTASFNASINT